MRNEHCTEIAVDPADVALFWNPLYPDDEGHCLGDCPRGAVPDLNMECKWRETCVVINTEAGIDYYSEMCDCAQNMHMQEAPEWSVQKW